MRRRSFVRIGGLIGIGVLAGCSGNGNENNNGNSGSSTTGTATEEPGAEESDPTATEGDGTGTEDGNQNTGEGSETGDQNLEQYDDTEPEIEAQYEEERRDRVTLNWMEFENPEEQIPQENYSLEEFPTLDILQYDGGGEDGNNAYDPENETVYLGWAEKDGKMALDVAVIYEWGDSLEESELHSEVSTNHTEEEADIEGILRDVIEGYNEVSENMEEEYRELL